jgi:hypothetical protein
MTGQDVSVRMATPKSNALLRQDEAPCDINLSLSPLLNFPRWQSRVSYFIRFGSDACHDRHPPIAPSTVVATWLGERSMPVTAPVGYLALFHACGHLARVAPVLSHSLSLMGWMPLWARAARAAALAPARPRTGLSRGPGKSHRTIPGFDRCSHGWLRWTLRPRASSSPRTALPRCRREAVVPEIGP